MIESFLLTDVEGSTRLWQNDPNWQSRHDAIVAGAVANNGGRLLKDRGEGDSAFAVFPTAATAIAAARDMQLGFWPSLRVRIAVHTGDVTGIDVNRCARLRSLAHGGQVVLTTACVEALEFIPAGVTLRDLGAHRLRDFADPERVFQLCHPSLPADFDALTPPDNVAHVAVLAESVLRDVARLRSDAASLSLSGVIELSDQAKRAQFLEELKAAFTPLAERYAPSTGEATYRIAFVCHPSGEEDQP